MKKKTAIIAAMLVLLSAGGGYAGHLPNSTSEGARQSQEDARKAAIDQFLKAVATCLQSGGIFMATVQQGQVMTMCQPAMEGEPEEKADEKK